MATALAWTVAATNAVAFLALAALAGLVLRSGARNTANRLLALSCVLAGLNEVLYYAPIVIAERTLAYQFAFYADLSALVFSVVYLAFVGQAVDAPLARPLRSRATLVALGLVVIGLVVTSIASPALFIKTWQPDAAPLRGWSGANGALLLAYIPVWCVMLAYTFACAMQAWRRAPRGTLTRRRAAAYLAAFAVQDLTILTDLLLNYAAKAGIVDPTTTRLFDPIVVPIAFVVFAGLVVRAMLRYQLFDFDLKLKLNIKRGTLAAIFVGVFFVVAQIAQSFLTGAYGWLAGGAAAGLLLFAIAPLQRVAERVADTAMPRTTGAPDYIAFKKLEVYKAAVETAFESGYGIDARERTTLDRLREKLGLRDEDAVALEAEVRDRFAPPAQA